ncbi:MAG: hypothetical protein LBH06_07155 [Rikenellaceae bacterium]|nr:hypothetical protein [Rikenellaceae bacterium]
MKKFIFCLGVAAFAAGCLKPIKTEVSPVAKGITIYNCAVAQHLQAMEPVNVAFRLHILLSEAQAQGAASLDDVTVTIGNQSKMLKEVLFGSNSLAATLTPSGDVWTISYPSYSGSRSIYDGNPKFGTLTVDTGGSLLDADGAVWSVSTLPDASPVDRFGVVWVNSYSEDHVYSEFSNLTITRQSASSSWNIDAYNVKSNFSGYIPSSWTLGFTLSMTPPAASLTTLFETMLASEYTLSGDGYGTSFYALDNTCRFTYNAAELKYSICNYAPSISGGDARATIANDTYDITSTFPASHVELVWNPSATDRCKPSLTISYNGSQDTQESN